MDDLIKRLRGLHLRCIAIVVFLILAGEYTAYCQHITISGKITDQQTGEPVSFASVGIKGTGIGTSSNFDGLYKLKLSGKKDSLTITCMGYRQLSVKLSGAESQVYNIKLKPVLQLLKEVRVSPRSYVNPAWEILTEVIRHKQQNDPSALTDYKYGSYTRIEIDATRFSENLRKKKFIDRAIAVADSMKLKGPDHMPLLPLFVSETVSDVYIGNTPSTKREDIQRVKTNGLGFEDGTVIAQLTGSTFQQYNFYKNHISAAGKDFVSPITDSWKIWYDYELDKRDVLVDGIPCYQISFKPKRAKDLAFAGIIWIAHDTYKLYQVKATISPTANLNFIDKITVQQQMLPSGNETPWLPGKTRILVEFEQLTGNTSGLLAKFYTSNSGVVMNKTYPADFFKENITVAEDVQHQDENYWARNRPDSLTQAEQSVYNMIDTIKNIPIIRNYITVADLIINGYYRAGKISIGPILQSFNYNNIEGARIRLGFKTNSGFNNKWILGGYLAYGAKRQSLQFGSSIDYILSRKNWTEAGASYSHDLNQVALMSDNYLYQRNALFSVLAHNGNVAKRKAFDQGRLDMYMSRRLFKSFNEKVTFSNWTMDPEFSFAFNEPGGGGISRHLVVSEIQFESRWAPGEQPLLSETVNKQLNLKTNVTSPVFTFRYSLGIRNFLGGDVNFNKFSFNVTQILKTGSFGRGKYSLTAGFIPSGVIYPLLENHLGNETFLYNPNSFNLMRFFEFASDKYVSLNYTQHIEGLIFNSLPVIKNFNWRLVATTNILYGSLSANNKNIPGNNTVALRGLGKAPYMEAGYGIENIFRFIRVDFIHRLNYLDNTTAGPVKRFGVKISAQFRL